MFPAPEPKLDAQASELDILSTNTFEWIPVSDIRYLRHEKPGKPASLRVDYTSGLVTHSEWVCLEHTGYPRQKAVCWWLTRAPDQPLPRNVSEALTLTDQLRTPREIAVRPSGRFIEIVGARF